MIKFKKGNIFESEAQALVNTVNTVGVMGKGIALQFKEKFPENYHSYKNACKKKEVGIGKMYTTKVNQIAGPEYIINFPTKKHWRQPSKYEYIEEGLHDLVQQIEKLDIKSIAIPPLGAGQGGLDWAKVKRLIFKELENLPIDVEVYEPSFQPSIEAKNEDIKLTKPRALILALINRYQVLGYDITHLEIQKLAYFLQRMGQHNLRLQYEKYVYGPFAHNLQHLLHHLEGSYLIGDTRVMDSKPLDNLVLRKEKIPEVMDYIEKNCSQDEKDRLQKIYDIIDGFESPFGVELLASVDWILDKNKNLSANKDEVFIQLKKWNKRKADSFNDLQVETALDRLKAYQEVLYR